MLNDVLERLNRSEIAPSTVAALFVMDKIDKISVNEYKLLMNGIKSSTKKSDSIAEQIKKEAIFLFFLIPKSLDLMEVSLGSGIYGKCRFPK